MTGPGFDLDEFLPYLLNRAAERASRGFEAIYKSRYGMTRTQWRVMAHLGQFGPQRASEICARALVEKTKVSRAVKALEDKAHLRREKSIADRRAETLMLTDAGREVFADLSREAVRFDDELRAVMGVRDSSELQRLLRALGEMRPPSGNERER
ncbi:MarR family winged helix-turn-helix transcriptional regulator [Paracoccaceae bacterium GXU_MW_L88]